MNPFRVPQPRIFSGFSDQDTAYFQHKFHVYACSLCAKERFIVPVDVDDKPEFLITGQCANCVRSKKDYDKLVCDNCWYGALCKESCRYKCPYCRVFGTQYTDSDVYSNGITGDEDIQFIDR
jgi:sulfatase maturation enzyme AslB (radical SAM superfamily)